MLPLDLLGRYLLGVAGLVTGTAPALGSFTGHVTNWAEGTRSVAVTLPLGDNGRDVLYASGNIDEAGAFSIQQPEKAIPGSQLVPLQPIFAPDLKATCRRFGGQINISPADAQAISFNDIRVALPETKTPSPGSILAESLWEEKILLNSRILVPEDSDGTSTVLEDLRWIYVPQPVTIQGKTLCTPAQTPTMQEETSVNLDLPAGWTAIVKRLTFADGTLKSETVIAPAELSDAWEYGVRD